MANRGTSFVLTIFKQGDHILDDYAGLNHWWEDMRKNPDLEGACLIGQIEEGEEHHEHIQAYFETKLVGKEYQKLGIKAVRSLLRLGQDEIEGHIEICKSPEDAKKYVHKMEGRLMNLSSIGELRVGRYDKLYLRMIENIHNTRGAITTYGFHPIK